MSIRERISAWANSVDQDARDLQEEYAGARVTPISKAPDREMALFRGTLRTVTLRPRGGVPALDAELFDGTGVLTLTWLGRRRIAGITPGRSIQVEGRVSVRDGDSVMYNPRYELMP